MNTTNEHNQLTDQSKSTEGRARMTHDRSAKAERLIDDAWESASSANRVKLARRALAIDADMIDAFVILAIETPAIPEQVALLREAIAIGERRLAKDMLQTRRCPPEGRQFGRAMHNLVVALWQRNDINGATSVAERMLRLLPDDRAGIRFMLMSLYGREARWYELERLLRTCRRDRSRTEYAYSAVLCAFVRSDQDVALEILPAALRANPHVPRIFADSDFAKTLKRVQPSSVIGSEDEAISYAWIHGPAWLRADGSLAWLDRASRGLEPAPRDIALNYPPPRTKKRALSLTLRQQSVLTLLSEPRTSGAIRQHLGISRQGVQQAMRKLEERQLVKRTRIPGVLDVVYLLAGEPRSTGAPDILVSTPEYEILQRLPPHRTVEIEDVARRLDTTPGRARKAIDRLVAHGSIEMIQLGRIVTLLRRKTPEGSDGIELAAEAMVPAFDPTRIGVDRLTALRFLDRERSATTRAIALSVHPVSPATNVPRLLTWLSNHGFCRRTRRRDARSAYSLTAVGKTLTDWLIEPADADRPQS